MRRQADVHSATAQGKSVIQFKTLVKMTMTVNHLHKLHSLFAAAHLPPFVVGAGILPHHEGIQSPKNSSG